MNRRQALQMATVILGGIMSPGVLRATTAGIEAIGDGNGKEFSNTAKTQVRLLAELIIPRTNTPGAIEAGVPQFIEMMVRQWYTATEREIFIQGLQSVDAWCKKEYGQALAECELAQMTQALSHFEQQAQQYQPAGSSSLFANATDENTPFFTKIKELTVLGYFTSEVGIRQSLAFNPMPMEYRGDIPFADGDKQWAQY